MIVALLRQDIVLPVYGQGVPREHRVPSAGTMSTEDRLGGIDEEAVQAVVASAKGLCEHNVGLWSAGDATASSFSEDAHARCMQTETDSFWFEHRNRCIVELVRQHPPSGPILDVGGGNGYVALGLRRAGFDAIVLEPGNGGAQNALRRGLAPVLNATLEHAAFADGSLPAVGLFDVVEHITDDGGLLRDVAKLLEPSGRLFVTVPAYRLLWSNEDVAAGHVRRYDAHRLQALLVASGFEVDYLSYFFAALPPAIFAMRVLPEWLGRERTVESADDHRVSSMSRSLVMSLFSVELEFVRRKVRVPFGASILAAARKRS